jgi:hypothetical protein
MIEVQMKPNWNIIGSGLIICSLILSACALSSSSAPNFDVSLTNPPNQQTVYYLGLPIPLKALIHSYNADISRTAVTFYGNGVALGNAPWVGIGTFGSGPWIATYNWNPRSVGLYQVQARAYRNDGSVVSVPLAVCVIDPLINFGSIGDASGFVPPDTNAPPVTTAYGQGYAGTLLQQHSSTSTSGECPGGNANFNHNTYPTPRPVWDGIPVQVTTTVDPDHFSYSWNGCPATGKLNFNVTLTGDVPASTASFSLWPGSDSANWDNTYQRYIMLPDSVTNSGGQYVTSFSGTTPDLSPVLQNWFGGGLGSVGWIMIVSDLIGDIYYDTSGYTSGGYVYVTACLPPHSPAFSQMIQPLSGGTTTPISTLTSIPTLTTTPTDTPTTAARPQLLLINNANCRKGPGTMYNVSTSFVKDTILNASGRNDQSNWWLVNIPSGGTCWMANSNVSKIGPVDQLVAVQAPPLPDTPSKIVNKYSCDPKKTMTLTVDLNWANVAEASGYNLFRNDTLLTTVGSGSTSYTDKAPLGVDLTYAVEALNANGHSGLATSTVPACK